MTAKAQPIVLDNTTWTADAFKFMPPKVNDKGGKIFSKLEVAQSVSKDIFTRVFATPQSGSIEGLAKAYGWEYRSVSSKSELDAALTVSGRVVIEIALS